MSGVGASAAPYFVQLPMASRFSPLLLTMWLEAEPGRTGDPVYAKATVVLYARFAGVRLRRYEVTETGIILILLVLAGKSSGTENDPLFWWTPSRGFQSSELHNVTTATCEQHFQLHAMESLGGPRLRASPPANIESHSPPKKRPRKSRSRGLRARTGW